MYGHAVFLFLEQNVFRVGEGEGLEDLDDFGDLDGFVGGDFDILMDLLGFFFFGFRGRLSFFDPFAIPFAAPLAITAPYATKIANILSFSGRRIEKIIPFHFI